MTKSPIVITLFLFTLLLSRFSFAQDLKVNIFEKAILSSYTDRLIGVEEKKTYTRRFASHKLFAHGKDFYLLYSDHESNLDKSRYDVEALKIADSYGNTLVVYTKVNAEGERKATKKVAGLGNGRREKGLAVFLPGPGSRVPYLINMFHRHK